MQAQQIPQALGQGPDHRACRGGRILPLSLTSVTPYQTLLLVSTVTVPHPAFLGGLVTSQGKALRIFS